MRGTTVIREAREEGKRRQAENSGNFTKKFRIEDGESAVVRFLESGEDIVSAYVHHVPNPNPRSRVPIKIVCRDQDPETGARVGTECPGCEDSNTDVAKRRLQGAINLIWRNGPVFEKGDDGRIITDQSGRWVVADREDQVVVWNSGVQLFDQLVELDTQIPGGLTSRDFKVSRKGKQLDTEYTILPAEIDGGPKALSKADKALEKEKYDLTDFEAPRSYEDFWGNTRQNSNSGQTRSRASFQQVPADVSPFTNDDE